MSTMINLKMILFCMVIFLALPFVLAGEQLLDRCQGGDGSQCWVVRLGNGVMDVYNGVCASGQCGPYGCIGNGVLDGQLCSNGNVIPLPSGEQCDEQCDDGNRLNGDGCDSDGLLEQPSTQECFPVWTTQDISWVEDRWGGDQGLAEFSKLGADYYELFTEQGYGVSGLRISDKKELTGNFDINVDFDSLVFGSGTPKRNSRAFRLDSYYGGSSGGKKQRGYIQIVKIRGEDVVKVKATYINDIDKHQAMNRNDEEDSPLYSKTTEATFSGIAGNLRITRVGTTFTFYYIDSSGVEEPLMITSGTDKPMVTRISQGRNYVWDEGEETDAELRRFGPSLRAKFHYTVKSLTYDCHEVVNCGNGAIDNGEQCDGTNLGGLACSDIGGFTGGTLSCFSSGSNKCKFDKTLCTGTCTSPICGNGRIETGEVCDDGNTADLDGCSSTCQTEQAVCGNNIVETGETCDDGNRLNGDSCPSDCIAQSTLECRGANGPAGYWRFDEGSWTGAVGEVKDSSDNTNDGKSFGNANTIDGGKIGKAGTFDGDGDYVSVPDSDSISLKEEFSISLWVKDEKATKVINKILYKNGEYAMQIWNTDRLFNYYWINSNQQSIAVNVPYPRDGAWRHVVTTLKRSGTNEIHTLYIDGNKKFTKTATGTISTTANDLMIGLWGTGFKGKIDEVSIWNKALTDTEVSALYNSGSGLDACILGAYCGDGNKDVGLGEECDDGRTDDGDGCSSECKVELEAYWADAILNKISQSYLNDIVLLVAYTPPSLPVDSEVVFEIYEQDDLLNPDDPIRTIDKDNKLIGKVNSNGRAIASWEITPADMEAGGNEDPSTFYFETSSSGNSYADKSNPLILNVENSDNPEDPNPDTCDDYTIEDVCVADFWNVKVNHEGYDEDVCGQVDLTTGCYVGCGCEWLNDKCNFVREFRDNGDSQCEESEQKLCKWDVVIDTPCGGENIGNEVYHEDGKLCDNNGNNCVDDAQCPDGPPRQAGCGMPNVILPFFDLKNGVTAVVLIVILYVIIFRDKFFGKKKR